MLCVTLINHVPKESGLAEKSYANFGNAPYRALVQTQKRFIAIFDEFLESVVQQAIDRSGRRIRDIKSYIDTRRDTGGVRPTLVLTELGLDMDIPDEVISHPAIQVMITATNDMVCLFNDMISYNVEQARGDDHNIVAIVMHEFDTEVNSAMLWVADLHKEVEKNFSEAMAALPKWGKPIDSQVRKYCDGLGSWVRGNDEWSLEFREQEVPLFQWSRNSKEEVEFPDAEGLPDRP
ncbi:terpenoid synthase [Rhizopogon vinicolor AM-OR11-026]|uniref:Terpene synthase n=1 Tax=Rhizopogon vinicolor AM-OR11-026 TaxID=1314800 RepID=A0A1B7MTD7_9AGAM|nr:terpenoid synthase [Rhizopogon vinicolor AM-OR11-026]